MEFSEIAPEAFPECGRLTRNSRRTWQENRKVWEVEYLIERRRIDPSTARLLDELCTTDDGNRAYDVAIVLESRIAPVSGGLAENAADVLRSIVAALPWMTPRVREQALLLMTGVTGTVVTTAGPSSVDPAHVISAALPLLGEVAARGADGEVAQCIDLLSLAGSLGTTEASRATAYLERIERSAQNEGLRRGARQEIDAIRAAQLKHRGR